MKRAPPEKKKHGNLLPALQRAIQLHQQGRLDKAEIQYRLILKAEPTHFDALHLFGVLRSQQGHHSEALRYLGAALELKPTAVAALSNFGLVQTKLGHLSEALASYNRALALKPDHAVVLNNRGMVLTDLKRPAEALRSIDKALSLTPGYPEAHYNRGNALKDLKRPVEALASYDRALALKPNYAEALNNKGLILIELGLFDEASLAIERAIELDPSQARFYCSLVACKRLGPGDPRVRAMDDLARKMSSLPEDEQIDLNFALAKVSADNEDQAQSFRYLLEGNALKRKRTVYHEAITLQMFERTRGAFTREFIHSRQGLGEPSSVPVFVVGMPRSGTTLVEQILASHPKVYGAGEVDDFERAMVQLDGPAKGVLRCPEMVSQILAEHLRQLGEGYLTGIRASVPAAERITNKMPGNFQFVGLIHLALPNARIIHTRRDPVDTCLSCFSTLFSGHQPYCYDLEELGRYYRAYETLMAHWRTALPEGVMLEVRYEEVVCDLEGQARRMISHCGLEWDRRCLDFHMNERPVRTASVTQVRQPIYTSSVGRWRAYEPFLRPLLAELGLSTAHDSGN
jgi:tetratricopeptide (TPR) repeat protein